MEHLETPEKQVGVQLPPPPGVPGVRPGAIAASAQTYAIHQWRVVLSEGKNVCSARLLNWKKSDSIMVDQVKMATGEDVSMELLKVQLPKVSLTKLSVAPDSKSVKVQFGLSPEDEYGIPPEVDFMTALTIGQPCGRKGESCAALSACQMTLMPDRWSTLRRLCR